MRYIDPRNRLRNRIATYVENIDCKPQRVKSIANGEVEVASAPFPTGSLLRGQARSHSGDHDII